MREIREKDVHKPSIIMAVTSHHHRVWVYRELEDGYTWKQAISVSRMCITFFSSYVDRFWWHSSSMSFAIHFWGFEVYLHLQEPGFYIVIFKGKGGKNWFCFHLWLKKNLLICFIWRSLFYQWWIISFNLSESVSCSLLASPLVAKIINIQLL